MNRNGGNIYYGLPGIKPAELLAGIGPIRRSVTDGTDTVISRSSGVGAVGMGDSSGTNTSDSVMTDTLQDINGDGIPDVVKAVGGAAVVRYGEIVRIPGGNVGDIQVVYSRSAVLGGIGELSRNHNDTMTYGVSLNAGGGGNIHKDSKGRTVDFSLSTGASGSNATGTNTQTKGMLDINGDGLPDYVNSGSVLFGLGDRYAPSPFSLGVISYGTSSTRNTSPPSIGFGGSAASEGYSDVDKQEKGGAIVNIGFNAGIGYGTTQTSGTFMMLDVNGDGLPDKVFRSGNDTLSVNFNTGSGFSLHTAAVSLPGGSLIDYTSSSTFSSNGSASLGGTIKIPLPLPFVSFTIVIPMNIGAGINDSSTSSNVTVRMMDINGDGFVDQVTSLNGSIYAKLNLGAKVGLLKTITLPQGGTYELEYKREGNTTAMPQSRYVLDSVTMKDNESGDGVHEYRTKYAYRNGYYDRDKKEFYGFRTVTTTAADAGYTETVYNNSDYYAKGMELSRTVYDGAGVKQSESANMLDSAPYARVTSTAQSVYDGKGGSGRIDTQVSYDYDSYGNVTHLSDKGDITDSKDNITADITYWTGGGAKYLHSHPARIEVKDSEGRTLRIREGSYNAEGSLTELGQYYAEGWKLTNTFGYDAYGNMTEMKDSAGTKLKYAYDTDRHQYLTAVTQESAAGNEQYVSRIEWDRNRGLKTKETDPNGNIMRYEYDVRGRLKKIFTAYDGTVPAVEYEYTTAGAHWYAVTKNKITFDSGDGSVMLTVVEIDGLGRARRTAKSGEVYNGGAAKKGWNVSGVIEYDGKGRSVKEGQTYFVESAEGMTGVQTLRESPLKMERATVKTYDTLDRVKTTTLPDTSVMRNEYGLQRLGDGKQHQYTRSTDPLGNISVQYTDARGNIARVERRDADNRVLTSASYVYNEIGEMLKAYDATGKEQNAVKVEYDLLGRKTALSSPDGGRQEFVYNGIGQLWYESNSVLRGKGQQIRYEYDGFGRNVRIVYPEMQDVVYEYGAPNDTAKNQAGKVKRIEDESGTLEYEYGELGESIKETRALNQRSPGFDNTRRAVMKYRSDYLGRMQEITYPDGEVVTYGYDYGGNVVRVNGRHGSQSYTYVENIGYDEWGQRVYIKYGNGVETRYKYDANRRWLSEIKTDAPSSGQVLQNIAYAFDRVGNVSGYTNNAGRYSTRQNYTYDALYQLTGAEGFTEYKPYYGSIEYASNYNQAFTFDTQGLGNMLTKTSAERNTFSARLGDPLNYRFVYEYEEGYAHRAKRIGNKHYRYDQNGNVTAEQEGAFAEAETLADHDVIQTGSLYQTDYGWALADPDAEPDRNITRRTYEWNERNLLKRSSDSSYGVDYTYGADGERSGKYSRSNGSVTSETLYFNKLWSWYTNSLMEDSFTGRNSKNIFLGDTRVVTKLGKADGSVTNEEREKQFFYHSDHLGSAQLVTDWQGMEYERVEYTPYGELWVEKTNISAMMDTPFRFTGKERDKETGLYYYGARYLDSRTSRWLSTDPALGEYIPGAPINDEARKRNGNLPGMGGVFNTVNASLYHYAGNNPVKYTDPDGRMPGDSIFGFSLDPISDIKNFISQFDPSFKLASLFNAASNGDKSAQVLSGYIVHEASRDVLQQISDKSNTATIAFLAVGAVEAAGFASGVGMVADIALAIDDAISGDYKSAGIGAAMIVAGVVAKGIVKAGIDSTVNKGLQITVGKNGQFYEVGRRGAMNSWEGMQKLIRADIAANKFGDIAPEAASQLLNMVKKAYDALQE
ncbi:hypothetical protein FACS1894130_11000 [Spirochaetia bacterium]|nr:hypothetical protein FACS1894130_11000 [Spirochaetia bacterium]